MGERNKRPQLQAMASKCALWEMPASCKGCPIPIEKPGRALQGPLHRGGVNEPSLQSIAMHYNGNVLSESLAKLGLASRLGRAQFASQH